jgi:hypothetical protein
MFAVFHLMFWRLFHWRTELARLTSINRAVVQVLNLCLIFAFITFGIIALMHGPDLISTPLGRSLLVLIALFWLLRAIEQVIFFDMRGWISWIFTLIFVAGFALHALPLVL